MNSASAIAEVPAAANPVEAAHRTPRAKEAKTARRTAVARAKSNARERYFLADGKSDAAISVGRELGSEHEAVVAAFQERKSFFVVTEFRVEAQFKGRNTELVKEGVTRTE